MSPLLLDKRYGMGRGGRKEILFMGVLVLLTELRRRKHGTRRRKRSKRRRNS